MPKGKKGSGDKGVGYNTHVQIDEDAKRVLDALPWGSRRKIMSALVLAFADLDVRSGGLASHAILSGKFTIDMGLTEEARKVLDDARGDGEASRPSGGISGDEASGERKTSRGHSAKARKDAA